MSRKTITIPEEVAEELETDKKEYESWGGYLMDLKEKAAMAEEQELIAESKLLAQEASHAVEYANGIARVLSQVYDGVDGVKPPPQEEIKQNLLEGVFEDNPEMKKLVETIDDLDI